MDTQLKKLRKLTKFCRDNGITRIKTAEIELDLSSAALFPDGHNVPRGTDATDQVEMTAEEREARELEQLLWSSGGVASAAQ